MNPDLIAKKLRELRGKETLEHVSEATGLTVSAISNYENAIRIPRDEAKIKLARYYQKSVEEIFFAQ